MRKLASVQKIDNIEPIIGADNIELATILGWKVIIKKDEFKVNDLCVYIEIDSILPEKPEFEFLRSKRFRIKTFKLSKFGVISQGIAFPLTILPEKIYKIDEDVTKLIGVEKYDPESKLEKTLLTSKKNPIIKHLLRYKWFRKIYNRYQRKSTFPSWIPKTDETKLQSNPSFLNNKNIFYISEKIDGQSGTFAVKFKSIFRKPIYYICSRNVHLTGKSKDNNYWKVFEKLNLRDKLKKFNRNIVIQGEIVGPKIQDNKYKLNGLDFYCFSIYDIDKKRYVDYSEFIELCFDFQIKHVPILNDNFTLSDSVDKMIELSIGNSALRKESLREGIVLREKLNSHISFKVINPEFLLKHKL